MRLLYKWQDEPKVALPDPELVPLDVNLPFLLPRQPPNLFPRFEDDLHLGTHSADDIDFHSFMALNIMFLRILMFLLFPKDMVLMMVLLPRISLLCQLSWN